MDTKTIARPKINIWGISLLQAVFVVLMLNYLQPFLLQTSIERFVNVDNSPLTIGIFGAIIVELALIIGLPIYLGVKNKIWKEPIYIILLTVLWLILFFALLLFS